MDNWIAVVESSGTPWLLNLNQVSRIKPAAHGDGSAVYLIEIGRDEQGEVLDVMDSFEQLRDAILGQQKS